MTNSTKHSSPNYSVIIREAAWAVSLNSLNSLIHSFIQDYGETGNSGYTPSLNCIIDFIRWRESDELSRAFVFLREVTDKYSNLGANFASFNYLLCFLSAFLHPVCKLAHLLRGLGGISLGVGLACHYCPLLLTCLVVALFRGLYLPKYNTTHSSAYLNLGVFLSCEFLSYNSLP